MKLGRKIFVLGVTLLIGIFTFSQLTYAIGVVDDLRARRPGETGLRGTVERAVGVTDSGVPVLNRLGLGQVNELVGDILAREREYGDQGITEYVRDFLAILSSAEIDPAIRTQAIDFLASHELRESAISERGRARLAAVLNYPILLEMRMRGHESIVVFVDGERTELDIGVLLEAVLAGNISVEAEGGRIAALVYDYDEGQRYEIAQTVEEQAWLDVLLALGKLETRYLANRILQGEELDLDAVVGIAGLIRETATREPARVEVAYENEVERIIAENYANEPEAVQANLRRIYNHGRLSGTGKLFILPIDQGVEHSPTRSWGKNPPMADKWLQPMLAHQLGMSAYVAHPGTIRQIAHRWADELPLIAKMNMSSGIGGRPKVRQHSMLVGEVAEMAKLGVAAVGYTIYPGSEEFNEQMAELKIIREEAVKHGLAVIVWSYPRGGQLAKEHETAVDVSIAAAHLAIEAGAHMVKVKPPADVLMNEGSEQPIFDLLEQQGLGHDTLKQRIELVKRFGAFGDRRTIIFSGGAAKGEEAVLEEIAEIHAGGGDGSIVGRNLFTRPWAESVDLGQKIMAIILASTERQFATGDDLLEFALRDENEGDFLYDLRNEMNAPLEQPEFGPDVSFVPTTEVASSRIAGHISEAIDQGNYRHALGLVEVLTACDPQTVSVDELRAQVLQHMYVMLASDIVSGTLQEGRFLALAEEAEEHIIVVANNQAQAKHVEQLLVGRNISFDRISILISGQGELQGYETEARLASAGWETFDDFQAVSLDNVYNTDRELAEALISGV